MKTLKTVIVNMLIMVVSLSSYANEKPAVTIVSAVMRTNSPSMDITYRVDDSDNATVKVRALAFIDGTRSFTKVIRPVTWLEGTQTNLGDNITTGVDHVLTWDVGNDWDIDLGQLKVEILAKDDRGLLPFNWVTIPATATHSNEVTISLNAPTDAELLDAFFWQYASNDSGLTLSTNGVLSGSSASGVFSSVELVNGTAIKSYATPYIFKQMNLDSSENVAWAVEARTGITDPTKWHAENRAYTGMQIILGWGDNSNGQLNISAGLVNLTAISAGGSHNLALKSDGTVVGWGYNGNGQINIPVGLTNVTAIAAGGYHSLALKDDGTVVGWGYNSNGQINIPAGLSNVTAIAAGSSYSLALKDDGTVVGWGYNGSGEINIPVGLTNVTAISAGGSHNLALKSDGSVVGWGYDYYGQSTIPAGLTNVTAIAAGGYHSLALKDDGTVVGWGYNGNGQSTIPAGLTNVTAIAAGSSHSLALKSDGTVVGWGYNGNGQSTIPAGLTNVTAIAASGYYSLALKAKGE